MYEFLKLFMVLGGDLLKKNLLNVVKGRRKTKGLRTLKVRGRDACLTVPTRAPYLHCPKGFGGSWGGGEAGWGGG